jgi:hypothetical protein
METRDFSLTLWGGKTAAATAPTPTTTPASTHDILTSTEAAQLVGLSRKQFRRYQDSLPQIRQGESGWRYYRRRDVLRFFESIREQPEVPEKRKRKRKTTPQTKGTTGGGWCSLADCPELD